MMQRIKSHTYGWIRYLELLQQDRCTEACKVLISHKFLLLCLPVKAKMFNKMLVAHQKIIFGFATSSDCCIDVVYVSQWYGIMSSTVSQKS
jgi:hypothetical protein